MKDLILKTAQWHHDRNLIDGSTDRDQVLKLIQELGELSDSVCKGLDPKDDIGDMLVILINICERNRIELISILSEPKPDLISEDAKYIVERLLIELAGLAYTIRIEGDFMLRYVTLMIDLLWSLSNLNGHTLKDCLAHAYDEIKDRKGRMVDGIFVKEE